MARTLSNSSTIYEKTTAVSPPTPTPPPSIDPFLFKDYIKSQVQEKRDFTHTFVPYKNNDQKTTTTTYVSIQIDTKQNLNLHYKYAW